MDTMMIDFEDYLLCRQPILGICSRECFVWMTRYVCTAMEKGVKLQEKLLEREKSAWLLKMWINSKD